MRVERWNASQVFGNILDNAIENAHSAMDDVVAEAKSRCPVDKITQRDAAHKKVTISFTPRRGSNKGKAVTFEARQFQGRYPGQLRNTIRNVSHQIKRTKLRVYAGNSDVYYAHFIEKGWTDRGGNKHAGIPFLQPAFESMQGNFINRIKNGR